MISGSSSQPRACDRARKSDQLEVVFGIFSSDVIVEEWGRPSEPIPEYCPRLAYLRRPRRRAYVLEHSSNSTQRFTQPNQEQPRTSLLGTFQTSSRPTRCTLPVARYWEVSLVRDNRMHNDLRVAFICGGLPADVAHLEAAGGKVHLTIYHSYWLPDGTASAPVPPAGVDRRVFNPIIRSTRGHLAFFYPGLRHALNHDRPQVVHVLSEPWGLLAVQAACWVNANPPARLVVHGCDTIWHHGGSIEKRIRRTVLKYTLPRVQAYAAENSKALQVADKNGLPAASARAHIHTNPRNGSVWRPPQLVERDRARAVLGLSIDTVAVGILGRLVPQKGILLFLDAADILMRAKIHARFFVAGEGPLIEEVRRRQSSGIVFLGPLTHPHGVLEFFHALDVHTCPSLVTSSWEDQGPRSLLEAMMCGCIPVGSGNGGIPEMLGKCGVLTRSPDAGALAEAIVDAAGLAINQEERNRVSVWAHSNYSHHAVAEQLVGLWRKLVTSDRCTRSGRRAMS
jgi:glycosyltransferase involved in cell wall biosynthesis